DGLRCVDDPRVAPLRVAGWRVRGAVIRATDPQRFAAYVEEPPWKASHPWRWPETAVERQHSNTGLDFWIAPAPWRLEKFYLWLPRLATPIPSSPRLAVLLSVLFVGSLLVLRTEHRKARRADESRAG
ncbi:MAG: hypothetical protein ACREQQ_05220, partial [Candidatus Binatia bacterium]